MLLSRGVAFETAFWIWSITIGIFLVINFIFISSRIKKHLYRRFRQNLRIRCNHLLLNRGKLLTIVHFILKNIFKLRRIGLGGIEVICIAIIAYLSYDMFMHPLGINYDTPKVNEVWANQRQTFQIQFDRPFRQDLVVPEIKPEVEGSWRYEDQGISFLPRRIVFEPKESFMPGQIVIINIAHINSILPTTPEWDKTNEVFSAPIPNIISTTPVSDAPGVGTTEPVIFTLDNPDGEFVDWQVTATPAVEFSLVREQTKQFQLKFTKLLAQNTDYVINVQRVLRTINLATGETVTTIDPEPLSALKFRTVNAPALRASEPTGDKVKVDSTVKFTFDKAMQPNSVLEKLVIEPALEFATTWESADVLLIKPKTEFARETAYTVKILSGAKAADGGAIEAEIVHQFSTIGAVKIESTVPGNGSASVSLGSDIRVKFNQEVNKSDAQGRFLITPNITGKFSWDATTMIYNPDNNLTGNTKYSVKIGQGVKTIAGIDQRADYNFSFTSRPEQVMLNVPSYTQPYRYACNLTAASMALAYKGKTVSVNSLFGSISKDSSGYNETTNTWGNPNNSYVGDLYGGSKGYGVHWGPIASLINNYRPAQAKTGWNTTELLKEIEAGNPVIIWAHNGFSGSGANTTWNLPGSGNVYTVKGMHSYVVVGFTGTPESPSKIYMNNPGSGSKETYNLSQFNALWNTFGRAAVVVR